MLYTKIQQILHKKRIYMLTGLKVPSLACKRVLYIPQYNAKWGILEFNFEGLEMQQ